MKQTKTALEQEITKAETAHTNAHANLRTTVGLAGVLAVGNIVGIVTHNTAAAPVFEGSDLVMAGALAYGAADDTHKRGHLEGLQRAQEINNQQPQPQVSPTSTELHRA